MMSKKGILNLTAKKKRNGMLTWANTTDQGATQTASQRSLIVNGITGYRGMWIATGQDLTDGNSVLGGPAQEAQRTATTCFMRGLSEHIRIQTSSGLPWFWRRFVFTFKGADFQNPAGNDTPISNSFRLLDTTNGMQRLFFNELVNNMPNTINNHDTLLFKGAKGVDWNDPIIAPLDTRRITVKFDKTWTLRSGNANGVVTERKLWHPMNKNIVYNDDENGTGTNTSYTSVSSKAGMGDVYVCDFIQPGTGGGSTDFLLLTANSTLYWHEK